MSKSNKFMSDAARNEANNALIVDAKLNAAKAIVAERLVQALDKAETELRYQVQRRTVPLTIKEAQAALKAWNELPRLPQSTALPERQ